MLDKIVDDLKASAAGEPVFFLKIMDVPTTEVVDFLIYESLSEPFEITVTLASSFEINFSQAIEKDALLTVKGDAMDRYFHGVVRKFEHVGKSGSRKYLYKAEIVPYFRLLSLEKDCRIFQDMNVQDIISIIFNESGITSNLYEFRFSNKDRLRKYCVQLNETDMDFIDRLLQEEGIFYFFEHYKDKHLMDFGEDRRDYIILGCDDKIKFKAKSGMNESEECINSIEFSKRLCTGAFTHTNFNFKIPSVDLESNEKSREETQRKYEIYEYPGLYGLTDRGDLLARVRLKSHQAFSEQAHGKSNSNRLIPGYMFTLKDHDFRTFNKEYTVITIRHSGQQPQTLEEVSEGSSGYSNSFSAIPSSVNYSPLKTMPKPLMRGPQTATVVGHEGSDIDTDEYGRVKVLFHWDRKGKNKKNKEQCSCRVRCAQLWGGGGWGTLFTPRVGDEVVVDFINGDPDYPIIIGSVYNGDNMPLYNMKRDYTRTAIKTRSTPNSNGYNELRFEDKAGSEEVYLQGERDWNILIKNNKGQEIGHDETLHVANDRTKNVDGDQMETIGRTKTENVILNSMENVGLAKELSIGGGYAITVLGGMNTAVGLAQLEEVGLAKTVMVGKDMSEHVSENRDATVDKEFSITAGESFKITCGEAMFEMDKSGKIRISGAQIEIEASGEVMVNGKKIKLN
ncbi:MAG: type VI secretion system tip protein TssI/VgrG [Smithella sp.]